MFILPLPLQKGYMEETSLVVIQTKNWIKKVVVGCNFCPFANKEFKQNNIHYEESAVATALTSKPTLLKELSRLDKDASIATTLLIFPNTFQQLDDYLKLVTYAEKLLHQKGYDGIYQLASFHPLYQFADTQPDDPANYTNRSVYPMLHFLRESDIRKALKHYSHPEKIPENNINFAREKGSTYMKMLRDSCF
jgi:hypothetical protein